MLVLSYVTDMSQAIIFSQFPRHSFAGRKLWEARFLKTVNLQSGLARSAGKDRGFLQLVRVDGGALVNRSPQESLSTGSGVRQLCFDKAGVMYSQATVISPEVKR